jgi:hypothetical protein
MASRAAAPVVVAREEMAEQRWSRAAIEVREGLERRFGAGPQELDLTVNLALGIK